MNKQFWANRLKPKGPKKLDIYGWLSPEGKFKTNRFKAGRPDGREQHADSVSRLKIGKSVTDAENKGWKRVAIQPNGFGIVGYDTVKGMTPKMTDAQKKKVEKIKRVYKSPDLQISERVRSQPEQDHLVDYIVNRAKKYWPTKSKGWINDMKRDRAKPYDKDYTPDDPSVAPEGPLNKLSFKHFSELPKWYGYAPSDTEDARLPMKKLVAGQPYVDVHRVSDGYHVGRIDHPVQKKRMDGADNRVFVTPTRGGKYIIGNGHHRWMKARLHGDKELDVTIVRKKKNPTNVFERVRTRDEAEKLIDYIDHRELKYDKEVPKGAKAAGYIKLGDGKGYDRVAEIIKKKLVASKIGKNRRVDIKDLHYGQHHVDTHKTLHGRWIGVIDKKSKDPIEVVKYNGDKYIANGHHRYMMAKMMGQKTINANVYTYRDP